MNLHDLDTLRPTPLGEEIERRRRAPAPMRSIPDPNHTGRRITAGVVATAIFALAVAVGLGAIQPSSVPGGWGGYDAGWTQLPAPPEWRSGASFVWTGGVLLYWGGVPVGQEHGATSNGFAFDPNDGQWHAMAPAPHAAETAIGLWTGSEALFSFPDGVHTQTLAFDPMTNAWRTLRPGPGSLDPTGESWTWTGHEVIVLGTGGRPGPGGTRGLQWWALDPDVGNWQRISDADLRMGSAATVWTGDRVVVVSHDQGPQADAYTTASYDVGADDWLVLPDPPLHGADLNVDIVAGRTIAWNGTGVAQWFQDLALWRHLYRQPLPQPSTDPTGTVVGDIMFTWNGGAPAVWSADTSEWTSVPGPVPSSRVYSDATQTAAGDAVVVEEFASGGPSAESRLWLWKP